MKQFAWILCLAMIFAYGCSGGGETAEQTETTAETEVAEQGHEATEHEHEATEEGGEEAHQGHEVAADEQAALNKTDPVGTYGKGISLSEKMLISEILSTPEKYEDQTVLVSGTVVDVCPRRGCWINLASDKEFEQIQVKVTDGQIVFPLSAKGSEALVEGVVEKLELSEDHHRAYKEHQCEEKGIPFDSTSVQGPLTLWRIQGIGAEIKG